MKDDKRTTKDTGNIGEDIAVSFLESYRYSIISRNYYASHAEIDIIALSPDGDVVVFCEVKTRTQTVAEKYGRPAAAVGTAKQKNLIYAANAYMKKHPEICTDRRVRIDVIEVYLVKKGLPKVHHIQNAVMSRRGYNN